jgi:antitoxin component YwqK of YwqJK toxin-antitoxin module
MKPKLILGLALVLSGLVNYQARADQAWSVDKKRVFVEDSLHDTNTFVINISADKNPHRNMSPEEVKALWEQASRNGTVLYLYPDGLPQGFWSSQQYKKHGSAKSWYPNGQLAVDEQYDDGKLVVGTYYDEAGKLLCTMTNGTGRQLTYYMQRTGSRSVMDCAVTDYQDGLKNGVETIYSDFAKGEKISETHYKDGKQDGVEIIWDGGKITSESHFKDGLADGLQISWDSDGRTNYITNFRNGHEEGSSVVFLPDGTKYREVIYRAGEAASEKVWFTNGTLMSEEFHTEKGMMAKSYDFTGKQTGEVIDGNGTLVVARTDVPGFDIQTYTFGQMIEDKHLRLYAKLIPDDSIASTSSNTAAFHFETMSTEPLKTLSANLRLSAGVTSSNSSFTGTNAYINKFEPFELKFPMPYQEWAGDITADFNMELSNCVIHSQMVVLHREIP